MAVMHNRASRRPGTRAGMFCFLGETEKMFGCSFVCLSLKQWVSTTQRGSSWVFKILNQIPCLAPTRTIWERAFVQTANNLEPLSLIGKIRIKIKNIYITSYLSNISIMRIYFLSCSLCVIARQRKGTFSRFVAGFTVSVGSNLKFQATSKQTSKSTEPCLTERITHCGSWLQWPCCGLPFICKATERDSMRGPFGSNRPYRSPASVLPQRFP